MQSVTSDIRLFLMALHTVTYMASAQLAAAKIPKSRPNNGRSNGVNGTHELLPLILLWHALLAAVGCCHLAIHFGFILYGKGEGGGAFRGS